MESDMKFHMGWSAGPQVSEPVSLRNSCPLLKQTRCFGLSRKVGLESAGSLVELCSNVRASAWVPGSGTPAEAPTEVLCQDPRILSFIVVVSGHIGGDGGWLGLFFHG